MLDSLKTSIIVLLIIVFGLLAVVQFQMFKSKRQHVSVNIFASTGNATFVTFTNGQHMLINCTADDSVLAAIGRNMSFYDTHIQYVVITDANINLYGGCVDVLDRFSIDHIIIISPSKSNVYWDKVIQAVDIQKQHGADVTLLTHHIIWDIASSTIDFLTSNNSTNDRTVVKISYGNQSVLLRVNTKQTDEEYLLHTYPTLLQSDILVVGVNGGNQAMSKQFLADVRPHDAIVESAVGDTNLYSLRTIKQLQRAGSKVWKTDGKDIAINLFANSYTIH